MNEEVDIQLVLKYLRELNGSFIEQIAILKAQLESQVSKRDI